MSGGIGVPAGGVALPRVSVAVDAVTGLLEFDAAGTFTNIASGSAVWSTPSAIRLDDANSAVAFISTAGQLTHRLVAYLLEPTGIPNAAVITGIELLLNKYSPVSGLDAIDSSVQLVVAGSTVAGSEKSAGAAWPSDPDATATYGGEGDTWGQTLTGADVNANFGFSLVAQSLINARTVAVDYAVMRFWYTYFT